MKHDEWMLLISNKYINLNFEIQFDVNNFEIVKYREK